MATKFKTLISSNGDAALQRRSAQIESQAIIAQTDLVNNIKKKLSELELQLSDLTDLAPTSTVSLVPGKNGWSADKWVQDIQCVKMQIYNLRISLQIAEETTAEYFTE